MLKVFCRKRKKNFGNVLVIKLDSENTSSRAKKKFNSYLMVAGVGFSSESINFVDGMKLLKDRREEFLRRA